MLLKINNLINKFYYLVTNITDTKMRRSFYVFSKKYQEFYNKINLANEIDDFVVPFWKEASMEMEKILNNIDYSFLNQPLIRKTMFITNKPDLRNSQLDFLRGVYSKKFLKNTLKEEPIGNPLIEDWGNLTSHNTIHHLSHLTNFSISSNVELDKMNTIIEWGGGYGNMARICRKLIPHGTYIIIDVPVFSALQGIYLSTILGEDSINVVSAENKIKNGKINIVPLSKELINSLNLVNADLFMSTWALTESSTYALDYVKSKSYFNSNYLLLAHVADNEKISSVTTKIMDNLNGYTIMAHNKINNLKNNYYLFGKKK